MRSPDDKDQDDSAKGNMGYMVQVANGISGKKFSIFMSQDIILEQDVTQIESIIS